MLDNFESVIESVEKEQIVCQVDGRFGITRQLLEYLVSEVSGFLVIAAEREVTLALTHDLWIVVDRWNGNRARCPVFCNRQRVTRALQRRVDAPRKDQRIVWGQFVRFFVAGLRPVELPVRGVEVAEGKIGDEVLGIEFCDLQEIFFS